MDQVYHFILSYVSHCELLSVSPGGPVVQGSNPCNWAIIENRWGGEEDIKPAQVSIHESFNVS